MKSTKSAQFTLTTMLFVIGSIPVNAATIQTSLDLQYGPNDRNQLDLYLPDGVANAPIVVWLHGGAWFAGDKANPPAVQEFIDRGIGVASMNYRLSANLPFNPPTTVPTQWPGQLEDVRNAFGFLRANAATYGYDGSRLGAFGFSAGAHYAAWAGLDLASDPSTSLIAVSTYAAPTDLANMDADDDADIAPLDFLDHDAPDSPGSLLVGVEVGDPANRSIVDAASPAVYASSIETGTPLPSFQIRHGDQDAVVSALQSERLYQELIRIGGSPTIDYLIIPGAPHEIYPGELSSTVDFFAVEFENAIAPVPLPASLLMLLAAILGFLGIKKTQNTKEPLPA